MIFLTVGTQLPFDRLTRALDIWCGSSGRGAEVFGQIGLVQTETYKPVHFEWVEKLSPDAFGERAEQADLIVSHAGMGSIITAMTLRKPILIMPRRAHLNEHRNDHQFATIQRFGARPGVFAAKDEIEFTGILEQADTGGRSTGLEVPAFAEKRLIGALKDFIHAPGRKS